MINLLPDDYKRDIRAARTNVILLRYNLLSLVTVALIAGTCAVFYVIMHNTQSNAVTTSSDNSAIAASYNDVRKQADEYTSNLAIANQILSKSTNYTNLAFAITRLLPDGVVLDTLTLNAEEFNKQTSFVLYANSYTSATKAKESFEKSPLFTNVYFQNLTDTTTSDLQNKYPILITLSAKFIGATK